MTKYMRLKGLALGSIVCVFGIVHTLSHSGSTNDYSEYARYAYAKPASFATPTSEAVPLPACKASFIDVSTDEKYPIPHWVFSLPEDADHALVLAIAKTESRFKPYARSHRGAVGLMQLMPKTAHYMVEKHGALDVQLASNDANFVQHMPKNPFDFKDPYVSLAVGHRYITYLQDKRYIGDNIAYTLAAYNAGPANLRKWKRRSGRVSEAEFISRIPFKETRNYVRKVMKDYKRYKALMPEIRTTTWVEADNC